MIDKILQEVKLLMSGSITREQSDKLEVVLIKVLHGYHIQKECTEMVEYDSTAEHILNRFIAVRRLDGLMESTLAQYRDENMRMLQYIGKNPKDITTDDLRYYLASHKVSRRTLNNKIRYLNAFFKWLEEEEYMTRNPMIRIHAVKEDKTIKKPYTDEQREELKTSAHCIRDVAIMEVLYSTGVRVSELCRLNRSDIMTDECIVLGKGSKERKVYFSETSMYYLRKYMEQRTDDNDALFVWCKKPYNRLSEKGIESMLRNLGKSRGIDKVHPHRFRRTLATNALNRGMPIQEVKEMLGHEKIDTTMIYCNVLEQNVKNSHRKCA
jgi:site-specific recombinase XerD